MRLNQANNQKDNLWCGRHIVYATGLSTLLVGLAVSIIAVLQVGAQGFAQGYFSRDQGLKTAMAVVLNTTNDANKAYVERATQDTAKQVIGFTVTSKDNLVTIASAEQQVYVQTSGEVAALVNDVNGTIKKDDKLAISPLKGTLMRAGSTDTVVGSALQDFSPSAPDAQLGTTEPGIERQTIKTADSQQDVLVGKLSIKIEGLSISQAPTFSADSKSSLENFGKAVAGKDVTELQVVIALVIFLIVITVDGSIIYGSVSSGIISLGRNPNAKKTIRGEILWVMGIAVIILLVGLAAVYFVLSA